MSTKERLDVALVARGLAETRAKAQASIMSGIVYVNGQKVDKAGTPVAADAVLEVRGHTLRYVSRGGLKLEKAMAAFPITLHGLRSAPTSARLPAASPTVCCKTARRRSTPWTSATVSSTGSSAATSASSAWSAPTRAISRMSRSQTSWISHLWTCRSSRSSSFCPALAGLLQPDGARGLPRQAAVRGRTGKGRQKGRRARSRRASGGARALSGARKGKSLYRPWPDVLSHSRPRGEH